MSYINWFLWFKNSFKNIPIIWFVLSCFTSVYAAIKLTKKTIQIWVEISALWWMADWLGRLGRWRWMERSPTCWAFHWHQSFRKVQCSKITSHRFYTVIRSFIFEIAQWRIDNWPTFYGQIRSKSYASYSLFFRIRVV